MKKMKSVFAALVLSINLMNAQVVDFENFNLANDTFMNGSAKSIDSNWRGFEPVDIDILFTNKYDTSWGGYWSKGFAISTKSDSVTAGFTNLYSCFTKSGNNSRTFAVGQQRAKIVLKTKDEFVITSLDITNSSYAALSMKNGDSFAKKFGGTSGNDSDWFMATFIGYRDGVKLSDSVNVYLADYRFTDNSKDYILNKWETVDLNPIGLHDSIEINLSSSDFGVSGMNTPAFFCIDNVALSSIRTGIAQNETSTQWKLFPNPVSSHLHIQNMMNAEGLTYNIFDISGKIVLTGNQTSIDLNSLHAGVYFIQITHSNSSVTKKFIKQ
jgi:hypothetical protein